MVRPVDHVIMCFGFFCPSASGLRLPEQRLKFSEQSGSKHCPSSDVIDVPAFGFGHGEGSKWITPAIDTALCANTTLQIKGDTLQNVYQARVGEQRTLQLTASGPGCSEKEDMYFYGRLIGPSLVWVNISRDEQPCKYSAHFTVFEPGEYRFEIVKEYCGIPQNGNFPNWYAKQSYVGELIGGALALRVHVAGDSPDSPHSSTGNNAGLRACTADEVAKGYWGLQGDCKTVVPFRSAQWAWHPRANCNISSLAIFQPDRLHKCKQSMNIFVMGDSVARKLNERMIKVLPKSWSVQFYTPADYVGLDHPNAIQTIETMSKTADVVILNSGLHDYHGRTAGKAMKGRKRATLLPDWDPSAYKQHLKEAMDAVERGNPNAVKIFRSTTAGWMKWGNYWADFGHTGGYEGEVAQIEQKFWTTWHATEMLNRLASEVLDDRMHWMNVDGFTPSISRPDHVEHPGAGAFIHPGGDVLDVINALVLEQISLSFQC